MRFAFGAVFLAVLAVVTALAAVGSGGSTPSAQATGIAAFKPIQPSGPGKTIFMMAGMLLFVTLGLSLAVALALIDDRLYRRVDLDQLGIPVLAVIPPATARKAKPKAKAGARKRTSTNEPALKRPPTGGVRPGTGGAA